MKKLTVFIDDEEIPIPTRYEVCPRCDGEGMHTNSSIDGNGITGGELAEILYEDPDFIEDYKSGVYDVTCEECDGLRVVLAPDFNQLTEEEKQAWKEQEETWHADAVMQAAESRMCRFY